MNVYTYMLYFFLKIDILLQDMSNTMTGLIEGRKRREGGGWPVGVIRISSILCTKPQFSYLKLIFSHDLCEYQVTYNILIRGGGGRLP